MFTVYSDHQCLNSSGYEGDITKCKKGNIYLESDVTTDVAHFDMVLIHCANIRLHLYDTPGGQGIFAPFLG